MNKLTNCNISLSLAVRVSASPALSVAEQALAKEFLVKVADTSCYRLPPDLGRPKEWWRKGRPGQSR